MAKEKQKQKTAQEAWFEFARLCKLLFGMGDNCPYNMNEIKEDNEFYDYAKDLAAELEIDWDGMTHDESNRLMLALLDDYYQAIQVHKESNYTIIVNERPKVNGGK